MLGVCVCTHRARRELDAESEVTGVIARCMIDQPLRPGVGARRVCTGAGGPQSADTDGAHHGWAGPISKSARRSERKAFWRMPWEYKLPGTQSLVCSQAMLK